MTFCSYVFYFFFSSRRRHTRFDCDWSSDVCSSDLRMIVNNGIPAGMSSDGMQIAPMNPWLHMYYAVTGKNARGELINDGQQITRQQVMKLYTSSNGWFLREENQLGSIEVGKLGDLVVLNEDYFTVPEETIKKTSSVMSVVGGKIVHDTGALK